MRDARKLVGIGERRVHLVVVGEDALLDLGHGLIELVLLLLDGSVYALPLLDEGELSVAERADGLLAEAHGSEHVVLGDLLGTGLHHGDEVARAGELEIEIRRLALLVGGVDDELARFGVAADFDTGGRTVEGAPPTSSAADAPPTQMTSG